MRFAFLIPLFLLLSCGRPMTPGEAQFATEIHGSSIDTAKIRMIDDAPLGSYTFERAKRPRLACRERIFPEPKQTRVTGSPAAAVWLNTILFSQPSYRDNFMQGYPNRIDLYDAMLLAHEVTHAWQWQNRAQTGYSPFRSMREHRVSEDPYLFDISTSSKFLDYGYEQQASMVEEYVCCAVLDPDAPRTRRIATMLRGAFPMQDLTIPDQVVLPWRGVQIQGICR